MEQNPFPEEFYQETMKQLFDFACLRSMSKAVFGALTLLERHLAGV